MGRDETVDRAAAHAQAKGWESDPSDFLCSGGVMEESADGGGGKCPSIEGGEPRHVGVDAAFGGGLGDTPGEEDVESGVPIGIDSADQFRKVLGPGEVGSIWVGGSLVGENVGLSEVRW